MSIKPILKIAENLFNDGFVPSKADSGTIYNVVTAEIQKPPQEILDILVFLCEFNEKTRSNVSKN